MRWGSKLIFLINIVLVLVTLLAYISPYIHPSKTWFFSFFALGFPLLLLFNIVFIILWFTIKPKYSFLSILCLILGWQYLKISVGLNLPKDDISGLKVMSYNIGHTKYKLDEPYTEKTLNRFKTFLQDKAPDIVCLQERTKRHLSLYDSVFQGYNLFPSEFIGTAIYSKLDILDRGNLYFDTNAHNATWIDVNYKGQRIRIYSVHLSSNKIKQMPDNESLESLWNDSKFIVDKYNLHAIKRTEQLKQILTHIEQCPYPVLLTGDFNDVPLSYIYRMACKQLNDAFVSHGFGFGKTHNTMLPILRIDYAFHSEDIKVTNQKLIKIDFSDHYPLMTFIQPSQLQND